MKKILELFILLVLSLILSNSKVKAFHYDPPQNSIRIEDSSILNTDMDIFNGIASMSKKIYLNSDFKASTYVKVYEANKLLNTVIHTFSDFYICNDNQEITLTKSYTEEDIEEESYEKLVSNSLSGCIESSVEAEFGLMLYDVDFIIDAKITSEVGEIITNKYIRKHTKSETTSISYKVNSPGAYILEKRKLFKVYLFEYYTDINEIINNKVQYKYGTFLYKRFLKLVPVNNTEMIGFYRYNLNGTKYNIDQSALQDNDKILYI